VIAAVSAACLLAVIAIVAGPAVGDPLSSSTAGRDAPAQTAGGRGLPRSTWANRLAAIDDAQRLLDGVKPPSGSLVLERRSEIGVQRSVPVITPAFASALSSEHWSVPGEPGAVLSYVESRLPAGSKLFSTGSSGPNPVTQSVIRSWSPVNGILDTRLLMIEVTVGSSGKTLLSAESQSQWVVVRPARERVPASVREVEITDGLRAGSSHLSRRVTAPQTVKRIVALFNALGIVQPGSINCPSQSVGPTVTVVFRAATGRALATATVYAGADFSWPDSVPGWSCFSIAFTAEGRRYPSLIGNVTSPLDRLLHLRLQQPLSHT
jgi:hypothetical protein